MNKIEHTPIPWKLDNRNGKTTISGGGRWIATIHQDAQTTTAQIHPDEQEATGNAFLMLRACNEHAALVAVAEAVKNEHAAIENSTGSSAHVRHVRALRELTRSALATLAQIRGGAK